MTAHNVDNRIPPAATGISVSAEPGLIRATGIAAAAVVGGTAVLAAVDGNRLLGILAFGATALVVAALLQGRRLLARAQAATARQAARADRLHALLNSVPGACAIIDAERGDEHPSPALMALLGIETAPVTLDHVIAAFAGDDELAQALTRLAGEGQGFTRDATCVATGIIR